MESPVYKIIGLDDIHPCKFQLREDIREELTELAESIRIKGVLQPICVTPDGDGYEIIWGHRRYFASLLADCKDIPCQIIKNISDEDKFKLALIENSQRKELNPIEEAKSYKRILEELKITQDELGKLVGKERSVIAHTIRLLTLPEEIQAGVSRDTISPGHARALLRIEDKELQLEIFRLIVEKDLSVRQTEELVEKTLKEKKSGKKKTTIEEVRDDDLLLHTVWNWLSGKLGSNVVNIREYKKKRVLELSFGSADNLIKLIKKLSRLKLNENDIKALQKVYEKKAGGNKEGILQKLQIIIKKGLTKVIF